MSEPLVGVIVSHSAVAQALVAAVQSITGVDGALVAVSNEGCDYRSLAERLDRAVAGRAAVLFVDLPGGSCLTGAARYARGRPQLALVTGVNLAMLLDFVFSRDVTPADAARRAVATGANAIRVPAA
jgi:mannose/fructose-specific phosphotransferase system component IIA